MVMPASKCAISILPHETKQVIVTAKEERQARINIFMLLLDQQLDLKLPPKLRVAPNRCQTSPTSPEHLQKHLGKHKTCENKEVLKVFLFSTCSGVQKAHKAPACHQES